MEILLNLVKSGMSITKVIETLITDIDTVIGKLNLENADSQFLSMKQSYQSYKNNNYSNSDLKDLIQNLRDLHNTYYSLVRIEKKLLLHFIFGNTDKPYAKNKYTALCVNISSLLSLLYKELNEEANASQWKKQTLENFMYYKANYYHHLDIYILSRINSSRYLNTVSGRAGAASAGDMTTVTEDGEEYLNNRLREWELEVNRFCN